MGLSLPLIAGRVKAGDHYRCKEALQADLHRMVPPSHLISLTHPLTHAQTSVWIHYWPESPEGRAAAALDQQVDELCRDMQLKDFSLLS